VSLSGTDREFVEVVDLEVVGRAAAPVHDVLVLTLTALLAVPVGQVQVIVHPPVTELAVLEQRVEERLKHDRRKLHDWIGGDRTLDLEHQK
jgi:hypothetical protein